MNQFNWKERSIVIPIGKEPVTQRQWLFQKYYEDLFKPLAVSRKEILEIGCGRCTLGQYFARDGKSVECTDIEQEAVELARANFNNEGLQGKFKRVNATYMPYGKYDRKYKDMIISVGLIEHLNHGEWHKIFFEAYRALRPGGVLAMINVPKKFSIQTFFQKHDHYHREETTPEEYVKVAKQAGFDIVKYIYVNPFPLLEVERHEQRVVRVFKFIYWLRSFFTKQPIVGSKRWGQAHLLICLK